MDNNSLSASDICRIIKQCHASGVAEVNLPGGVSFKFHPRRNEDADQLGPASDYTEKTFPVVSEFPEANTDQVRMMDQENMLEAEEAQLLIDDPFAFEKVQMDRHIERARMNNNERT
jgi:hypothetical protein